MKAIKLIAAAASLPLFAGLFTSCAQPAPPPLPPAPIIEEHNVTIVEPTKTVRRTSTYKPKPKPAPRPEDFRATTTPN